MLIYMYLVTFEIWSI